MLDFQQKTKIRKFFYSRPVVAIILTIALYSIYSTWSIYEKMVESRKRMEKTQIELLALSARGTQLDTAIGELQTQDGKEREIRSKFGQAKSGESMAIIVPDNDSSTTTSSVGRSAWSKFLHFFGL